MTKNKKIRSISMLFLLGFSLQAQTVGTWKSYMAYNHATIVTETPNAVYAVYDGSLLSYSRDDQSVQTYSIQDDLSPSTIRFLNYCPDTKALLIVYDNSNIDIFLGRNNVYHLPDIKNHLYLSNKTINSVEIRGGYAYLATGFGIVVIDMRKREIKNTYPLETNTMAVCEWGDYLYAATDNGLIRALQSSNLADKENWSKAGGADGIHIDKMVLFNDHLVLYNHQNLSIWRLSRDGILNNLIYDNLCKQMSIINDQLMVILGAVVIFYKDFDTLTGIILDDQVKGISSVYSGGNYWVAWGDRGLVEIDLKNPPTGWTDDYDLLVSNLKVNSPGRNFAFRLKFSGEKLLVTGGDRAGNRMNRPGTFMIYENGIWQNMDDRAIAAQTGLRCEDLLDAVEDPHTPGRYYVSSFGEGIYVLNKDLELETLYSLNNSSLQSTLPSHSDAKNFVRVDGMVFDANHNLYSVSAEIANGLNILSNTDHWTAHVYEYLSGSWPNRIIIARDGKKWVNFFRKGSTGSIGIFVLDDTKGIVDDSGDDSRDAVYFSSQFIDQQNRSIGASAYTCIVEDLTGTIWVGTDNGPITFSSAEQVGRGECYRITGVDQYGDGYYLLEGQKVTAIAVDGGNRKWIGTDGGGLFRINQSGDLTVENFNTSNSSILSDNITSIAIHGKTGEVFIGTNRGICSYQGDAIEGRPDYSNVHAFPNPVFPRRNNQVVITGLMQNSRIKITDMAGNLMKEAISNGGQYTWNCTNPKGEIVTSGIYLVFAALEDGSQGVVTKIMIVR